MERFAQWVIKYRLLVVIGVVALTAAGAVSIAQFAYVESDISKYLDEDDPVVIRFNEAGERFGGVAMAMVGLDSENLFTHEGLMQVHRLTEELQGISGVSWVISLTNIDDVKETLVEGEKAVSVSKLIEPNDIPKDPGELERLRNYVLNREQLVGTVVSADGRVANIICNISGEDRVEVATQIEKRARELADDNSLYFTGFPYWMKFMSAMIMRDMVVLVPFVILVVIVILFLSFRSLRGVVLPLATVLISTVWAMGLMAALDIPITTLSNTIPVLLIALGSAYAIHLLHKYNEVVSEAGTGEDGEAVFLEDNIRSAIADVMVPICLAGLTTAIGFLSFLTSDLLFIKHTGVIAAFGILSAMAVTLTFLPAVLSCLKPRRTTFDYSQKALSIFGRVADSAGRAVLRHRRPLLAVALVIAVTSAIFIPSLDRRFDMVSYFPEGSEVRRGDDMMREKLGGNTPVWVTAAGEVKNPYVLKCMWMIGKFLRSLEFVDHPKSVASLIAEMNDVLTGNFSVPDTPRGVGNLWLNLEGKDVLRQFVDKKKENALVQAVCSTADTANLRKVTQRIDEFLALIPQRVIPVELESAEGSVADGAREARLDRVTWMVKFDLDYRLKKGQWKQEQVRSWILEGLQKQLPRTDPGVYRALLEKFMLSDESDLEFPDESLVEKVAIAAASEFAAGGADIKRIQGLVNQILPAEVIKEDPQAPAYLAKSLMAMASEVDEQRKVVQLLDALLERLPKQAAKNLRLVDDLRGDLGELAEAVAFLPLDGSDGSTDDNVIKADFQQTGNHQISVNVDNSIVFSQLSSLGLAVLLATILLIIQFHSVLAGLLGMVPMCLTLLINFGVMGIFRIHLEPSTVLIASLVVGVGIDYTIHFMSRTRLELIRQGKPASALDVSLKTAGRAILINAVTVMGGQLVFLAGDLQPLRTFGVLLALAMVVSAISAVTVLPAILMAVQPKFLSEDR